MSSQLGFFTPLPARPRTLLIPPFLSLGTIVLISLNHMQAAKARKERDEFSEWRVAYLRIKPECLNDPDCG